MMALRVSGRLNVPAVPRSVASSCSAKTAQRWKSFSSIPIKTSFETPSGSRMLSVRKSTCKYIERRNPSEKRLTSNGRVAKGTCKRLARHPTDELACKVTERHPVVLKQLLRWLPRGLRSGQRVDLFERRLLRFSSTKQRINCTFLTFSSGGCRVFQHKTGAKCAVLHMFDRKLSDNRRITVFIQPSSPSMISNPTPAASPRNSVISLLHHYHCYVVIMLCIYIITFV